MPDQPPGRPAVDVLAEPVVQELALDADLGQLVGLGPAELAPEDQAARHAPRLRSRAVDCRRAARGRQAEPLPAPLPLRAARLRPQRPRPRRPRRRRAAPAGRAVRARDGRHRWHRCLRCDSWLPFADPTDPRRAIRPSADEIELPLRGKPLRDKIVLRAIAVDRALHFLILAALAVGVFLVAGNEVDLRDKFYAVLGALHGGLGGPTDGSDGSFVHRIDDFLNLPADKLKLIAAALAAYALLQALEGGRAVAAEALGRVPGRGLDLGLPADRDLRADRQGDRAQDRRR